VIEKYGVDPMRFYLSHEVPVGRDGNFSWKRMNEIYDAKLRNDIGNLLNRVLVLVKKDEGHVAVPQEPEIIGNIWETYAQAMDNFELSEAFQAACALASKCNAYIDKCKPWSLEKGKRENALGILAENLRHIALMLLPFIPGTARRISKQLGIPYADEMAEKEFTIAGKNTWGSQKEWKSAGNPKILFPPVE